MTLGNVAAARYHAILELLKVNGVTINAGPLLVIPPAIHSLYFFDPNGIRLESPLTSTATRRICKSSDLAALTETELRTELETISSDRTWIDEMVAAMTTPNEVRS